jgi:hypothetical protein
MSTLTLSLSCSIGNCTGMPIRETFRHVSEGSKSGSNTSLVTAMIKYGTKQGRLPTSLTDDEKKYLQTVLNPTFMRLLHYPPIPMDENNGVGLSS